MCGRQHAIRGSTIIIGPRGEIRYVISKNIRRQDRLERQVAFQEESPYWKVLDGQYRLGGYALPLVHQTRKRL
jgi:hypothetical protein